MFPGWINQFIAIAAVAIGGWIASRIRKPTDLDRAQALAIIARAAAALAVSMNPTATWGTLLTTTVAQILAAAGLPTQNRAAVERAAASALADLGKLPNG